ncbi:hypothetical protein Brms1b_009028 [Colletotrichum noveboracense]|nr:hypothetical protein CBS470a_007154 [Colletotrichum nupharicola]KAJ0309752.1 hypothetical protein Brms1b_009028 [Colletotrichum noveboracense]
MGIMFMVKNIDFGNISIIKTMQAGSDSNIISELNMIPDDYNWVATIQGVSSQTSGMNPQIIWI